MNSFRTELSPTLEESKIDHLSRILTIGSCFSDSIGNKLKENKFLTLINPFGAVYNPVSIHELLTHACAQTYPPKSAQVSHQGLYFNYQFHSKFFDEQEAELSRKIREAIDGCHQFIKDSSVLIITYGTAFVYQRNDTNEIVANCHKVPDMQFTRRLLDVEEIISSFGFLHKILKTHLPVENIVLTVSPVRHLTDTLELNSLSKSTLRVACQKIVDQFPTTGYFPSYEIMMDDLRDYRFYKADMIHPTEQAEDYIWEKFSQTYFSKSTLGFLKQWDGLNKAIAHRPLHANSSSHKAFLKETISRLEELRLRIDVEREISQLKSQLQSPIPIPNS